MHHAILDHALREVLVRGPDAYFFDARIGGGAVRGRSQRVVGFQLDHRPDDDAHRGERALQRLELSPQRRLDSLAGLVIGPQVVAERFDHVIGRDADMRGALLDHLQHGVQYAGDRPYGTIFAVGEAAKAVEMPVQLVRTVQQVDDQSFMPSSARTRWTAGRCSMRSLRAV